MEAAFCMQDEHPLRLYDSLVPKIYDHAYSNGLKCKDCQKIREDFKIKEVHLSLA